jgi:tetrahydromethanopterin S-methyltransferase subunit G
MKKEQDNIVFDLSVESFANQNFSRLPEYLNKENFEYNKLSKTSTITENTNENNMTNSNDNSEIVYRKINAYNHNDVVIGKPTLNTHGQNNDTNFNNNKKELINYVIFETEDETLEEFSWNNFAFVKCNNITTIKLNNQTFSFLTNPINSDKFFFIELDKNKPAKFQLISQSEYIENQIIYNKSEYSKLKNLTDELNELMKPVMNEIFQEERKKFFIDLFILLGSILFFSFIISFFSLFLNNIPFEIKLVIFILMSIVGIFIIGKLIYKIYYSERYWMHSTFLIILKHQVMVEDLIAKWNKDYFNNIGIKASVPVGYRYIQFDLKSNITIKLLDHEIFVLDI